MSMNYEYMDLNEDSKVEQIRHAEVLRRYETTRRAKQVVVPTAIDEIKQRLRELGQPVTLYGEGHVDRRERLREVIAKLELSEEELGKLQQLMNKSQNNIPFPNTSGATSSSSNQAVNKFSNETYPTFNKGTKSKETFYSPAEEAMIQARRDIADYSFKRACQRLQHTKRIRENSEMQREQDVHVDHLYNHHKDLVLNASQFGDDRPMTTVRYSVDGQFIASGSLGSAVKIWDSNLTSVIILRNHAERVTSVAWHPQSVAQETLNNNHPFILGSASADGTCNIWDISSLLISKYRTDHISMDVEMDPSLFNNSSQYLKHSLRGHQGVVAACEFHPSGKYIGTAGHDYSWRFWDIEMGKELLLQDCHIHECCAIAFHPDGSLVMSADSHGVVLLWDIRSGQAIHHFQGHTKKISSVMFNINGFQAATSCIDNTVRVWDLRKKKCGYVLPAHTAIISDVRYSKSGELLLTSSFDGTIKIWSTRDHHILRTLSGHTGKVMSADFSPFDEKRIVSAGFDRTIKVWAHKDEF